MQRGGEERSQGRKEEEELVEKRGSRWIKRRSEASEQDLGSCHLLHDLRENAVPHGFLICKDFPTRPWEQKQRGSDRAAVGTPLSPHLCTALWPSVSFLPLEATGRGNQPVPTETPRQRYSNDIP